MPATADHAKKLLRVLIVEDEPRMRELLVDTIPDMGFPTTGVRLAEEALRIMQTDPREILILDIQLPMMNGMELFEEVRKRWPAAQVIVLTGYGDLAAAQRAVHLDAVEFLSKPCHLRDIELALDRARRRIKSDFVEPPPPALPPADDGATLAEHECQQILSSLRRHAGNKTAAAAELAISRRTLHYKLAQYRREGRDVD